MIAVSSIALAACTGGRPAIEPERPNVILIVADDLGWNDVGYHGSEIRTPNIDALASDGVRLERFYVTPICSPTRMGLLTGRTPIRYGRMRAVIPPWRRMGIPSDEILLPAVLRDAGYSRRAAIGKWHLGHSDTSHHPLRQGFTHFYGHYNGAVDYFTHEREGELDWHDGFETSYDEGYATDLLTERAVRFIEGRRDDEPFFLYLAYNAPHTPLQAPAEAIAAYPHLEEDRQVYAAMVTRMDEGIGKILHTLVAEDISHDTMVWFMSDNGGNVNAGASNAPLRSGKQHMFEGGIRVPAVVRWTGQIPSGRVVEEPIAYIDVFPTILGLTGVQHNSEKPLDGVDVLSVLQGLGSPPSRDIPLYWGQSGNQERLALIRGAWKAVYYGSSILDSTSEDRSDAYFFNLEDDPNEENDLSEVSPDLLSNMLDQLKAFRHLRPADGIPPYAKGREGFRAPPEWRMELYHHN